MRTTLVGQVRIDSLSVKYSIMHSQLKKLLSQMVKYLPGQSKPLRVGVMLIGITTY